jgi:glycine cleavage system H lipoate-binding protein
MTVLLILVTFAAFIAIEYFLSKQRVVAPAEVTTQPAMNLPAQPKLVAGFLLPDHLRYHPGHTWALAEGPQTVRVGWDDFAAKLIGPVSRVELPRRGQWIRQGQKIVAVYRDGSKAELASPIEGMVSEVNDAVVRDPEIARRDPYGEGWLLAVQSPDAKVNFRNLLSGTLAKRWTEDAVQRLLGRFPQLAGAVAQDGGIAVADLTKDLPDSNWSELTQEFFLG